MGQDDSPVVLVTGAARRVGAAIARVMHGRGARVALHCRSSRAAADALALELNGLRAGSALVLQADLLQEGMPEQLLAAVLEAWGRLDGLVNNASSFYPTPLGEADARAWDDLVGTNFRAPFFLTQAAAEPLRRSGGAVVNIVDIHGERPLKRYPIYSAAKAGLIGLTRALAVELAPGVRVNGVAPGPIEWPEDDQFDAAAREAIRRHTLLQREGSAEDIARSVAFLLFDATYVTGQILAVDGGRSAHL